MDPPNNNPNDLSRVLGLRDLSLLIVGSVIGSGIFLVPGNVLKTVGNSVPIALGVWFVGGIFSLLGALSYGEMGAMNPRSGGLYVYIRDAFGRLPAFLYGWTLFFMINAGGVATLSVAASGTLNQLVPMSIVAQKAVSVMLIAILAGVNVLGTRKSADLQNWTTVLKAGVILLMSAALLLLGHAPPHSGQPAVQVTGSLVSAFGVAMISVLWAYEGWQQVTFSAGETIDPHRTVPRAFLIGTLILMGIYLLSNVAYVAALGPGGLATTQNAATASLGATVGGWAATAVTVVILISMFSAANATFLTGSRVYYAMASDRLFFSKLAEVHPRYGTPALAVIVGAVWSAGMAITGTFNQLLTYVVFSGWIFYALGAAAVFRYRRTHPDLHRPYRVPAYPWPPLLFIISALALVGNTIYSKPKEAAIGLGLVMIGLPAYFWWNSRLPSGSLIREITPVEAD